MRSTRKSLVIPALCLCGAFMGSIPAQAWEPSHPIEIIIPAGTGGGADQMARVMQGIITKHNLSKQSVVVINQAVEQAEKVFWPSRMRRVMLTS